MRIHPSVNSLVPKVCAGCGQTMVRRDTHRNRYGEYLCRACQASGVKSTRMGRLKHSSGQALAKFLVGVAIVLGVAVVLWIAYALAMHLNTPPDFVRALFQ